MNRSKPTTRTLQAATPQNESPFRHWYGPARNDEIWDRIERGGIQAVHLSTPPAVTGRLTRRLADMPIRLLIAEKPWFASVDEALEAAAILRDRGIAYRGWDHYLERTAVRRILAIGLPRLLHDQPIERIIGRLWEPTFPASPAQEVGVLSDLLVHLVSLCYRLLPAAEFHVLDATAARHPDWAGETETSASLTLQAESPVRSHPIAIELSAAKGVDNGDAAKELDIVTGDSRLHIDLAADTAVIATAAGVQRIESPPGDAVGAYHRLAASITAGEPTVGLTIDGVIAVLRVLEAGRKKFGDCRPIGEPENVLPGVCSAYGVRGGRT
jgi:predicted dehydrogenase